MSEHMWFPNPAPEFYARIANLLQELKGKCIESRNLGEWVKGCSWQEVLEDITKLEAKIFTSLSDEEIGRVYFNNNRLAKTKDGCVYVWIDGAWRHVGGISEKKDR